MHGRHYLMARNLAATLQRYRRDTLSAFEHATEDIVHLNNAEPLLTNLNIRRLCVVDPWSGATLKSIGGFPGACPESLPEPLLTGLRDAAKDGGAVMTGIVPAGNGEPTVFIVRNDGDHLMVGDISRAYFSQRAREISFGINGRAILVDQNGRGSPTRMRIGREPRGILQTMMS